MFKKMMALVLVLTMVFSTLPAMAQATETGTQTSVDNGEVTVEGTNSFGNLLSEEITESQENADQAAEDYEAGYSVTDLVIEGNVATVTYDTLETANLVVAIYTEDGLQLVTSGNATVEPEETTATVTIAGEMPQYFMAAAYLLDTYDLSPLCPAYDTPMYTQDMQELLASTVEDYEADRVLQLDDDTTTNFAVYADSTKVIEYVDGYNVVTSVDDENATYVIENADEQITGLNAGDVFVYAYSEEEMLIVKVASISISGTTATITGDEVELEEVFSHVKIEGADSTENMEVDASAADEGITFEGITNNTPAKRADEGGIEVSHAAEFSIQKKFGNDSASITVSGSLSLVASIKVSFYVSAHRQYCELRIQNEIGVSFTITGKLAREWRLCKAAFYPVPLISVKIEPTLKLEISGEIEFSASYSNAFGFAYNSKTGFKSLKDKAKFELDVDVSAEVFFGVDLKPQVELAEGVLAEFEIALPVGLSFSVCNKGAGEAIAGTDEDVIHECETCLDVRVYFVFSLSAKLRFLKCKWLTIEKTFLEVKAEIGQLYFSIDNNKFGTGSCPFVKYKVTVQVKDANGKVVAGAKVSGSDGYWGTTNENGVLTYYVLAGTTLISTVIDGETVTNKVKVTDATKITIKGKTKASISNSGGSLNLSDVLKYLSTNKKEDVTDYGKKAVVTVHVAVSDYWDEVYAYTWVGDEFVSEPFGQWPGSAMVLNNGWYEIQMSGYITNIIINNGGTIQTEDISIEDGRDVWIIVDEYNQARVSYGDSPAEPWYTCGSRLNWSVENNILKITGTGTMSGYPYTSTPWGAHGSSFYGVMIDSGVEKIGKYAFKGSPSIQKIQFCGSAPIIDEAAFYGVSATAYYPANDPTWTDAIMGSGGGNLTWVAYEGLGEDIWNNSSDDPINPSESPMIYYDNTSTMWDTVYAFFWNSSTFTVYVIWPGEKMTNVESNIWGIEIPQDMEYVIFSNGQSGEQTEDLLIPTNGTNCYNYYQWGYYTPETVIMTASESGTNNIAVEKSISTRSIHSGDYRTETDSETIIKTATYTDLVPFAEYALLVMVDLETDDPLTADNILYIDQAAANEDGTLTFRYVQRVDTEVSYIVACGASNKNLNAAEITFPLVLTDGQTNVVHPVVVYDGKTLEENRDYVILGDADYTEVGTYTCYIRGIYDYTGTVECTYDVTTLADLGFKFNTAAPALSDDIVMNIATTIPAGFSDPYMVVEFNGVTSTITDYTINPDNGRYVFAFPGINPQTMGDTFHATVYADVGGYEVSVDLDYSMIKYINSQLKKSTTPDALRTALSDLVMYGEANQVYEGYKTDALLSTLLDPTATLTPSTFPGLDDSFNKQATAGTKDANIDLKGVSMVLGSKVIVRMTLQCADTSAYSVKVNIGELEYTYAVSDLELAEGYTDRYVVEFDQIKATQFGDVITFSFVDASGNAVGRNLTYTVYSYIQKNQNVADGNLANLLQAIYNYGEAVKNI